MRRARFLRSWRRAGSSSADTVGSGSRNILRSALGSGISTLISLPLSLLSVTLVLRVVSLDEYGVWVTVSTLLALAGLADVGVSTQIVRKVAVAVGAKDREAEQAAVNEGVTVLVAISAAVVVLGAGAAFVFPTFLKLPSSMSSQDVVALGLFVTGNLAATLVLTGRFAALRGLQRVDLIAQGELVGSVSQFAVAVGGAYAGGGVWALAAGASARLAAASFVQSAALRRLRPGRHVRLQRLSWRALRTYAGVSTALLVASTANLIDHQLDKVLLASIVGPVAAASYQLGATLALQARALALLPISLLLAGTAELQSGDKLDRVRTVLANTNGSLAAVGLGGVMVLAEPFVAVWLGESYQDVALAATVLSLALLINACTGPWYYYSLGKGWFRLPTWGAAANLAVNAVVSWTLIVQVGLLGALWGSVAGNFAGFVVLYLLLRKKDAQAARLSPVLKPVICLMLPGIAAQHCAGLLPAGWLSLLAAGAGWLGLCLLILKLANVIPPISTVRAIMASKPSSADLVRTHDGPGGRTHG